MAKQQQQALPGRRRAQPTIEQMVKHYAQTMETRADLTPLEKQRAIKRYKTGLEEGGAKQD